MIEILFIASAVATIASFLLDLWHEIKSIMQMKGKGKDKSQR